MKNEDIEIVKDMKARIRMQNLLEQKVYSFKLNFHKNFKHTQVKSLTGFPKLSMNEIKRHITFGSYQIKQCFSYLREMFQKEKEFSILVLKEGVIESETIIIKKLIPSRHESSKDYQAFVEFNPYFSGKDSIKSWYWLQNRWMLFTYNFHHILLKLWAI